MGFMAGYIERVGKKREIRAQDKKSRLARWNGAIVSSANRL